MWAPNQIELGSSLEETKVERKQIDEEAISGMIGYTNYKYSRNITRRGRSNSVILDRKLPSLIDECVMRSRNTIF